MSTVTIETKNAIIEEHTESQSAVISFKGAMKSEDYRKAMLANYKLCMQPHIKNWLQNNKEANVLSLADQEWVSKELIPNAAKHVEKIAVVVSDDVFRKFAAKNILEKEKGKLNFRYFNTMEDAIEWLKAS